MVFRPRAYACICNIHSQEPLELALSFWLRADAGPFAAPEELEEPSDLSAAECMDTKCHDSCPKASGCDAGACEAFTCSSFRAVQLKRWHLPVAVAALLFIAFGLFLLRPDRTFVALSLYRAPCNMASN